MLGAHEKTPPGLKLAAFVFGWCRVQDGDPSYATTGVTLKRCGIAIEPVTWMVSSQTID